MAWMKVLYGGMLILTTMMMTNASLTRTLQLSPVKDSRYCNESQLIASISKQGRSKRSTTQWPFNCVHPSVMKYNDNYTFMLDIFECCQKCETPKFARCVKNRPKDSSFVCPSKGIRCMFDCIKMHGPRERQRPGLPGPKGDLGGQKGQIPVGSPGPPGLPGPKGGQGGQIIRPPEFECERKETLPNGNTCIRRLCIKLV